MLPFENLWDASNIKRQVGRLLITAFPTWPTGAMTACERPPGETLPASQEVNTPIGGQTIQPGRKMVVVMQVMPHDMGTQKHLLGDIIGILSAAEQPVDIGMKRPLEPLIQGLEIKRMGVTRNRNRCLSTLSLGCFFHCHTSTCSFLLHVPKILLLPCIH